MLNEFKQYLLGIVKSENTALNYCDKVKLYFKWCLDSFGSEPQQLYRANVLDYISYMKTIKRYSPKSVNNHLSSLRSFNEFLIFSGRQTELAIVKNDFMKIQTQYANPCKRTVSYDQDALSDVACFLVRAQPNPACKQTAGTVSE